MKKNNWYLCLIPLYLFTLLFILGPLVYMFVLSFATRNRDFGIVWGFSLENFIKMFDPIYVNSYIQSFKVAFSTTILVALIGYPFGYIMAKMSKRGQRILMLLIMIPFWTSSLIRIYGWIIILQVKGIVNTILLGLGIISEPLKILYSYPAVLIGMVYALLPFMILSVYSSVEKMDWSLVEAAKDLGASPFHAFMTIYK